MTILTVAEMYNSPSSFLARRFNGTVIKTERLGIVYVSRVRDDRSFVYNCFSDVGKMEGGSKTASVDELGDVLVARPQPGVVNTRFGLIEFLDNAGHQWSWGASESRLSHNFITVDEEEYRKANRPELYWYLFQEEGKTYLNQWVMAEKVGGGKACIAVSRDVYAIITLENSKVEFINRYTKKKVDDWYDGILESCCNVNLMQLLKNTTLEKVTNYV